MGQPSGRLSYYKDDTRKAIEHVRIVKSNPGSRRSHNVYARSMDGKEYIHIESPMTEIAADHLVTFIKTDKKRSINLNYWRRV